MNKLDLLLKSGLGSKSNIEQYKRALADTDAAVKDYTLRPLIAEVTRKLLDFVLEDDSCFNKLRYQLARKTAKRYGLKESEFSSLVNKSQNKQIPLEIIIEVYQRGLIQQSNLSPQETAFNRVNSFLNGGKALEEDVDLIEKFYKTSLNEQTPALTNNSKLLTIRKVIKSRC